MRDGSGKTERDRDFDGMTARDWRRFALILGVGVATGLVCLRLHVGGVQRLAVYLVALSLAVWVHDAAERRIATARIRRRAR